ncbi:MAG: DUF229 domain-containing protein [Gammaproteobacteria bacterium]|nr:DUF229 domain-containing protein [Gammaproteobacteria bacterium]
MQKYQNCSDKPSCRYKCFDRDTSKDEPDFHLQYGEWQNMTKKWTPMTCTYIKVQCFCQNKTTDDHIFYTYVHYNLMVNQSLIKEKDRVIHEYAGDGEKNPLSVVLLIIDAVSHSNFIRKLPNTLASLEEDMDAFVFNSYTKFGDNSLPNAVAFLLGKVGYVSQE